MRCVVLALSLVVGAAAVPVARAADHDERLFELRTYYASPGNLDNLLARFRDHTCKLFEKHGISNVGYWVPIDNADNKLVYMVAHKDRESAKANWKAFGADPDWQKAYKESEANGKLVNRLVSVYMNATDYSPAIKAGSDGERVFELRTYTCEPGRLDPLNARFRDHTCKLFEKYGMTNIGYWNYAKDQKGADVTLFYILAHKSVDAAKASFDGFRKDPEWVEARKASEEKAGGSLTIKDGVKSEFVKPTDFSPLK
jgi:hypothetical protein